MEFDNCFGSEFNNPSSNDVALFKDNITKHLVFANDQRTVDYE